MAAAESPRSALLATARAFGLIPADGDHGGPSSGASPAIAGAEGIARAECDAETAEPSESCSAAPAADCDALAPDPRRGRRQLPSSFSASNGLSSSDGTARVLCTGPLLRFEGRQLYVVTEAECKEACALLERCLLHDAACTDSRVSADVGSDRSAGAAESGKGPMALGFDTEWLATFQRGVAQRPVATVQLASAHVAIVFHLSRLGGVPQPLAALLGRSDILKVGVGAEADARKLERDWRKCSFSVAGLSLEAAEAASSGMHREEASGGLRVLGVLELNEVVQSVLAGATPLARSKSSLADLCLDWLGHSLDKTHEIRCGNWEAVPLSEAQLRYAATDAYAGVRILAALHARSPGTVAKMAVAAAEGRPLIPEGPQARKRPARDSETFLAAPSVADLPPAKRTVYRLFFENGLTLESIAELRGIQVATAMNYLVDAIAAGYAYDLGAFGVPEADCEAITAAFQAAGPSERRVKATKEALPEHISYASVRLVAVHLDRQAAEAVATGQWGSDAG
eukprot:CAMPEP_0204202584 /NCGR_PEP_ID=MMETSP0361-20130328/68325_1 /ASSEMBLY_ACC=CAM_ASM_000343 /TAXON_ID=268821 /ORGANISM="Scrippsiella Hangoei, Strain SHTV-5" /LENGTH=513 /DNA_ID=CAMNT_0051165417 /DNA_START=54 /DNA_END=1591 /DNA_ORIENTATION=+